MNELIIHEDRQDDITIFELQGACTQKNLPVLENLLTSLTQKPKYVLLDCSKTSAWEKECLKSLHKFAIFFEEQGSELAICRFPGIFDFAKLHPLKVYNTKNEALQEYRQHLQPSTAQPTMPLIPPTTPPKAVLTLTVIAGPHPMSVVLEAGEKELLIGRHSKCALSLPEDIKASRFHCKVYEKNGLFVLEDLQSSNGTFYEDEMITAPTEIHNNAIFKVGETTIQAHIDTHDDSSALPDLNQDKNNWLNFDTSSLGGMETVIGIPLESLLSNDATSATSNNVSYSAPKSDVNVVSMPNNIDFNAKNIPTAQDWSLIQRVIPTVIKRRQIAPPVNYQLDTMTMTSCIGESNSCFCMNAVSSIGEKFLVQYSKEGLLLTENKIQHARLLTPIAQGEDADHVYRIFRCSGKQVEFPLSETEIIKIGISLSDLLQALHESGMNGFDLSPYYIFFDEENIPNFAMLPAVIYENLLGETADIFSLGCLLYQLGTGNTLPYTPIGILDQDKFNQDVQKLSPEMFALLLEIFKREEQNLEKISEKLKQILWKRLSPHMESRQAVTFRILRMGNSIIYNLNESTISRIAFKENLSLQIQAITNALAPDNLVESGKELYNLLYPRTIRNLLGKLPVANLVLVLDEFLVNFPWELAYDGNDFLAHQFAITRSLFGVNLPEFPVRSGIPKVFFLSDEDETEMNDLEEKFSASFPKAKVKKNNIVAENHFANLQSISQNDIFHSFDPAFYNEEIPMHSGWKLSGDHLFRINFLETAYRRPKLIFQQASITPKHSISNFLAKLYSIGIPYSIGMQWDVKNNDFIIAFYQNLFQGLSVEQSLFQTRKQFADNPYVSLAPILYTGTSRSLIGYPKTTAWSQEGGLIF